MNQLPPEVLERIFQYLNPLDRLSVSEICRLFAAVISSPSLMDDIWLKIYDGGIERVKPVLRRSRRHYRNLCFIKGDVSVCDHDLWVEVGRHLRRLVIIPKKFDMAALISILEHCTELEYLEIKDIYFNRIETEDLMLPDHLNLSRVRESLKNLRVFRLDTGDEDQDDDILSGLLQLMPNVTSLFLRRTSDTLRSVLRKPGKTFTSLALGLGYQSWSCLDQILRKNAGSLQELDVWLPTELSLTAVCELTKLRHFGTEGHRGFFKDSHLERLVLNNPDLESLHLEDIHRGSLTPRSMTHIKSVRKLRNLGLYRCLNLIGDVLCDLGSLSKLQHLDVQQSISDIREIRSLLHLTDLRSLILDIELDSQSFCLICDSMKRLEVLRLDDCSKLTDEDAAKFRLLPYLSDLVITLTSGFTDLAFERGLGCPAMKRLYIVGSSITDAGLLTLAKHHNRLRDVQISCSRTATAAGALDFMLREPYLETLEMDVLADLAPAFAEKEHEMFQGCPRLYLINLYAVGVQTEISKDALSRPTLRRPRRSMLHKLIHHKRGQ